MHDGDARLAHADGASGLHERHLPERQSVGANDARYVRHQRNRDGDDGVGERGPEAAITSAITSSGRDCMMSIRRWTSRSNQPPKKPDMSPMVTPMMQPSAVAPTATASEMRAP